MADNEVSIIVRAVDKASAVMSGISKSIQKVNDSPLGKVTQQLTGFNLTSLGAAGAIAMIGKEAGKAISETSKYISSIEDMSRVLGISAEDTSRLVQASDDLFITQEKLNTALLAASRQGVDVSIKGLEELSKQYLELNPGVDRAQFLMKTFGRSGADMGKLMEVGASGIKSATAAISGSLVITDYAVQQNIAYKQSVDTINDAWEGIKVGVGGWLINSITPVLKGINQWLYYLDTGFAPQMLTQGQEAWRDNLIAIADAYIKLHPEIKKTDLELQLLDADLLKSAASVTDWETSFTDAKDASGKFDLSLKMLRSGLQEMGPEGEAVFQEYLLGINKIEPAAVAAMIRTKAIIAEVNAMLARGATYNVIVSFLNQAQGGGNVYTDTSGNVIDMSKIKPKTYVAPKALPTAPPEGQGYYQDESGKWINEAIPGYWKPNANGGSWTIPSSYGYEGYRMPGGQTASPGEEVKIIPKSKQETGGGFSQANMSQLAKILAVTVATEMQKARG